jgi:hypothetical protein
MIIPKIFRSACPEAKAWLTKQKSMKSAWEKCERPDWMLWALEILDYEDDRAYRLFACKCACDTPIGYGRVMWDLLTDDRSKRAIEVAILYAYDRATREELSSARKAALEAAWKAEREAARILALDAAWDAAWDVAWDVAWDAAWDAAWEAQANFLRMFVSWEDVAALIKKRRGNK